MTSYFHIFSFLCVCTLKLISLHVISCSIINKSRFLAWAQFTWWLRDRISSNLCKQTWKYRVGVTHLRISCHCPHSLHTIHCALLASQVGYIPDTCIHMCLKARPRSGQFCIFQPANQLRVIFLKSQLFPFPVLYFQDLFYRTLSFLGISVQKVLSLYTVGEWNFLILCLYFVSRGE